MDTITAQPQSSTGPIGTDTGDPTIDNPQLETGEQIAARLKLDADCQAGLFEVRRIFKARYLPKRMKFVAEAQRAFEALRGNTWALLNDNAGALDTINQLMQSFLGADGGEEDNSHNDNIYQMFGMCFIAALMVDLGKVRYQPAAAQDEEDLQISKKASTIQAHNERINDIQSLQQLELLYLWLTGSYFTYVRHTIDKRRAGTTTMPKMGTKKFKVYPDSYICPNCGQATEDSKAQMFSSTPKCPGCGSAMGQKDWFEGPELDLPVKVDEIEVANGMTAFDIYNGLMVDCNPDAMKLEETEILDLTLDLSAAKVRSAYPAMYAQIGMAMGSEANSDGDGAKIGRAGMTTPGSNSAPITTEGLVSYSRCWLTPESFNELPDETIAKELGRRYPDGCKLVTCGMDTFLDAKNESLLDHWTWCGTVKGLGLYPFAAGKVCLDVQERITGAVNKVEAYMDKVAFGTMLYDADVLDGPAMANKVLTMGNMTGVSRTDDEEGTRIPLSELMYQPTWHIDPEIYKYIDSLTTRAQMLSGVMPQIFGGSDKNVKTAEGQDQALTTALGRLKQYINQMRGEKAQRARISVKCSINNMDEEIQIVEEGEIKDTWQTIRLLKAELTGDFFTYPETDEGFPATYEEIQSRLMQLLAENQKMPFVTQLLSDPDIAAVFARYILPEEVELPEDAQRSKIKTILHRLSQDPNGPIAKPNPKGPQLPPIIIPTIQPEPNVDDPAMCQTLAKKWLLKNWEQATTNPKGYGNVLAYLTVSAQMAAQAAATAALQMASQHAQGQQNGASQGPPAQ